ncbi:MAG TPA: tail fiber protein [Baekduia sp.]|jgi:microcystin-dependent protein
MAAPFFGEIRAVAFDFAPIGWATCDGQLLPIAQNSTLFTVLGTIYGGDGESTFGLPDLQGQAAIGFGQGPGLEQYEAGQVGGAETVELTVREMPAHDHVVMTDPAVADQSAPAAGRSLARSRPGKRYQSDATSNLAALAPETLPPAGSGFPHNNLPPLLPLTFIIALAGEFPVRQ